jgi:hypothetical protein
MRHFANAVHDVPLFRPGMNSAHSFGHSASHAAGPEANRQAILEEINGLVHAGNFFRARCSGMVKFRRDFHHEHHAPLLRSPSFA